jgi:imidazole glycerol-phosphate synthase subunit HisH
VLRQADKLILPGVGAYDETMELLNQKGLKTFLDEQVLVYQKPIIGVCVGMQILMEGSEEGNMAGFGWIKGKAKKFDVTKLRHKPHLPHLGWNSIKPTREHLLFNQIDQQHGFYFLHSYFVECSDPSDNLALTNYGIEYACAVNHNNVYGVQFHPEKSHSNGTQIFKNFANL